MSGGRPAVYKNRPIVEDATRRAGRTAPAACRCAGTSTPPQLADRLRKLRKPLTGFRRWPVFRPPP